VLPNELNAEQFANWNLTNIRSLGVFGIENFFTLNSTSTSTLKELKSLSVRTFDYRTFQVIPKTLEKLYVEDVDLSNSEVLDGFRNMTNLKDISLGNSYDVLLPILATHNIETASFEIKDNHDYASINKFIKDAPSLRAVTIRAKIPASFLGLELSSIRYLNLQFLPGQKYILKPRNLIDILSDLKKRYPSLVVNGFPIDVAMNHTQKYRALRGRNIWLSEGNVQDNRFFVNTFINSWLI
jgi:hypothetical protein